MPAVIIFLTTFLTMCVVRKESRLSVAIKKTCVAVIFRHMKLIKVRVLLITFALRTFARIGIVKQSWWADDCEHVLLVCLAIGISVMLSTGHSAQSNSKCFE